MTAAKGRRLIDAVDDLTREIRTANLIGVLALTPSQLEDADLGKLSAATKPRHARLNRIRHQVRTTLRLDEGVDRG